MKVVFDTNVLLDIALARKPFVTSSMAVWVRTAQSEHPPMIAPHSLATFYYIVRQAHGKGRAMDAVQDLLVTGQLISFDADCAARAFELGFSDFEDAMIASAAVSVEADWILTRNMSDFKISPVPCATPEDFLNNDPD